MLGRTHQSIGIVVSLGLYLTLAPHEYAPATFAGVVACSYIGALLPDLDQAASQIWHSVPFGHTVGKVASKLLEHRNLSHSIVGMVIFGYLFKLLLNLFPNYWGINTTFLLDGFLIAYACHLLSDMITVEGIPLLFPYHAFLGIPPKPFDGARIVTGKWFENLVIFPLTNIVLFIIVITHLDQIKHILLK
jgi:membrane-bound metal-dependent hydrolase YbcI (DUF457 family)